jgi:hypothetical protein
MFTAAMLTCSSPFSTQLKKDGLGSLIIFALPPKTSRGYLLFHTYMDLSAKLEAELGRGLSKESIAVASKTIYVVL